MAPTSVMIGVHNGDCTHHTLLPLHHYLQHTNTLLHCDPGVGGKEDGEERGGRMKVEYSWGSGSVELP